MNSVKIVFDTNIPEKYIVSVNNYLERFTESGAPAILSLEHFSILVGISAESIFGMTNSPAGYYRTFALKKSTGGLRKIDAPLPLLLKVQRWILENILETQNCHPAAKAYVKKSSIKSNARFHRAQPCIIKTDVKNFFGSISEHQISKIFQSIGYIQSVAIGLAKLCCLNGALPQGAATSGYLSNILLRDFDSQLLEFCQNQGLRYSRYADDITISGAVIRTEDTLEKIKSLLRSNNLNINGKKTKIMKPHTKQKVTGIIVNKKLSVERKFLKGIRQECYFIEKYGIYGHSRHIGSTNPRATLERLLGQISHALFVRSNDQSLRRMKKTLLSERKDVFGV